MIDSSGDRSERFGTGMTVLEKLTLAIEQGHPNETEELVRKALEEGVDPVVLVEDVMVPVMREVG